MKKIKWGIISTGTIAKKFASTITKMSEGELCAVASRSQESADKFADEYGIAKRYASYEALCADPNIDVIYVGTPHSHHYENMMMCIKAKKHVLCEKAFTVNSAQTKEVFAAAKENNVFVMEAFWTKFLPSYNKMKEIINSGRIGKLRLIDAKFGINTEGDRLARKLQADLAGGALLDVGCYLLGISFIFFGYNPKVITSKAVIGECGTDVFGSYYVEFEDGVAQLSSAIGSICENGATLYCDKGKIVFTGVNSCNSFDLIMTNGDKEHFEFPHEFTGFEYQIREVCEALNSGKTESSIMTWENTLKTMQAMDSLRKSWGLTFPCE